MNNQTTGPEWALILLPTPTILQVLLRPNVLPHQLVVVLLQIPTRGIVSATPMVVDEVKPRLQALVKIKSAT
jgi:hypothetical protein